MNYYTLIFLASIPFRIGAVISLSRVAECMAGAFESNGSATCCRLCRVRQRRVERFYSWSIYLTPARKVGPFAPNDTYRVHAG